MDLCIKIYEAKKRSLSEQDVYDIIKSLNTMVLSGVCGEINRYKLMTVLIEKCKNESQCDVIKNLLDTLKTTSLTNALSRLVDSTNSLEDQRSNNGRISSLPETFSTPINIPTQHSHSLQTNDDYYSFPYDESLYDSYLVSKPKHKKYPSNPNINALMLLDLNTTPNPILRSIPSPISSGESINGDFDCDFDTEDTNLKNSKLEIEKATEKLGDAIKKYIESTVKNNINCNHKHK